jgi:negative regulator of sigma E activity
MNLLREFLACVVIIGLFIGIMIVCTGLMSPRPYDEATAHVERIDNIVRVFMHDNYTYSFYIEEGKSLKHIRIRHSVQIGKQVTLIQDVPSDKKMWAVVRTSGCWTDLEIHLHSAKSVEGGQWEGHKVSGRVIPVD